MISSIFNRSSAPHVKDSAAIARDVRTHLAFVGVLSLFCNGLVLALPLFNMEVFSRVLPTRDLPTLVALGGGLGIGLLAWAIIDCLRSLLLELLAAHLSALAAPTIMRLAVDAECTSQAVSAALSDLETIRTFLSGRACIAPFDLIWAPVLLVALVALHWALGLLGLSCLVLMVVLTLTGDAMARSAMRDANEATQESMRTAGDYILAAEAIVGLGGLPTVGEVWHVSQRRIGLLIHRALLRARAVSAVTAALRAAMTGAMVALSLWLVLSGTAGSAVMIGGNMILARLLMPIGSIASTRKQWIDAFSAQRRLRDVVTKRQSHRTGGRVPFAAAKLVVDRLTFIPPKSDRVVLRAVSLTVMPGQVVAVIGPSSSGKSTLLRAVMGMVRPTSGGAYLDGGSTYHWEREHLAQQIGYVPQRPTFLVETIADNVARLGPIDLKEVVRQCKRLGLHQVIIALPAGYATRLQPHILSAGQRQRLAVARALYGGSRLLVLDEPSAMLDPTAETDLLSCLVSLKTEGIAILFTTHKPRLLAVADRVLLMKEGSVLESGTPAELKLESGRGIRLVPRLQEASIS